MNGFIKGTVLFTLVFFCFTISTVHGEQSKAGGKNVKAAVAKQPVNLKVMILSPEVVIEPQGSGVSARVLRQFSLDAVKKSVATIQKQENFHFPKNFNSSFSFQQVDSVFWQQKMDDQDIFLKAFMQKHKVALLIWHKVEIDNSRRTFSIRYSYAYLDQGQRIIGGLIPGQPVLLSQVGITDELYQESLFFTFNQIRNLFKQQTQTAKTGR